MSTADPTERPEVQALREALRSREACLSFFRERGYTPDPLLHQVNEALWARGIVEPHGRNPALGRILGDGVLLKGASHPDAPRLLVLWRADKREPLGKILRTEQQDANKARTLLKAEGTLSGDQLPSFAVLAYEPVMLWFPLDGDWFARRLRFEPARLAAQPPDSAFVQHFKDLRAEVMAGWRAAPEASGGVLGRLRQQEQRALRVDLKRLYVGEGLDEAFVEQMGALRQRLLQHLLDPKHRATLLLPVLSSLGVERSMLYKTDDEMPSLQALAQRAHERRRLIAVADSVLLRRVLYRYLERQFGHNTLPEERQAIAFGSYDQLLEATTYRPTRPAQTNLFGGVEALGGKGKGKGKGKGGTPPAPLHPPALEVTQGDMLRAGLRAKDERYQASAGGDLHQGSIAKVADLLQDHAQTHAPELEAALLDATRSDRYSFDLVDLDPKAFQRFYESTIGTDIRLDTTGEGVSVQPWHRNRKEQGAFFTAEPLCRWLVGRTLGAMYDGWKERLSACLDAHKDKPQGRLPAVRALLEELMGWKVLDPTCGGGIFLAGAFQFLARCRAEVENLLFHLPEDERRKLLAEPRFAPLAKSGDWEWYVLLHMLYGVDKDIKALNIASNLLTLSSLAYKPNGVCFPSFINANLKPGNALVSPVRDADRRDLYNQHGAALRELIELRAELRNPEPKLKRDEWTQKHEELQRKTQALTAGFTARNLDDALGRGLSEAEFEARLREVGVFAWEVEFPEVFYEATPEGGVKPKARPGFDVVLGNPPWEVPAKQFKQFLPEYDPEYGELSGQASLQREEEWLARPEVKARWESFCRSVDDYLALLALGYQHQEAKVHGKGQGASPNLYKYAVELAWTLLREDGRAGLVLDGGLWGDIAAKPLRALLLDQARVEAVVGFSNNEGLFADIHRSYKFSATVFQKGGRTERFKAVFMRTSYRDLDGFEGLAVDLDAEAIRASPQDTYPVPEVRSAAQLRALVALEAHPTLRGPAWAVDTLSEEFHAGRQRDYFRSEAGEGWYPLVQGKHFNLFGVHQGSPPSEWVDPRLEGDTAGRFLWDRQEGRVLKGIADWLEAREGKRPMGKEERARAWIKAQTGAEQTPAEWVRLDWEGYRLAWRDITNATNQRTIIAAIVPPRVALTDKAPFVRPFAWEVGEGGVSWGLQYAHERLLYLAGMLSSFACDSLARSRLAKTDMSVSLFQGFHVPAWSEGGLQRRVAELTARLTCLPATEEKPWAEYGALAASVGLEPARDGLTDARERWEAEVELNALAAQLYGLGAGEFRFLMDELFMTPQHKAAHEQQRDGIAGRLG